VCEVAHTSLENRQAIADANPRLRSCTFDSVGGVMRRINLWSQSAPRVEIDQRSRDARLRFERTDEFYIVRRRVMDSRLRRLLYSSRLADTVGCGMEVVRFKNRL